MSKLIKQVASVVLLGLLLFLLLVAISRGQSSEAVAVGGSYTLQKTVVAGGGKDKQNSQIAENSTAGQSIAGHRSQMGGFTLWSGFWTPDQSLVPTAAPVEISGRVTSFDGRGIRNVILTLTSQNGAVKTVSTTAFGYYRFTNVEAGDTYVVGVTAKRFYFADAIKVLSVQDNIAAVDFVASGIR